MKIRANLFLFMTEMDKKLLTFLENAKIMIKGFEKDQQRCRCVFFNSSPLNCLLENGKKAKHPTHFVVLCSDMAQKGRRQKDGSVKIDTTLRKLLAV